MGIERRLKRQKQHEVKKMFDKEMRKISAMTDEKKVLYLQQLAERVYPDLEYADENLNFTKKDNE